jgi:hypothetical protein
MFDRILAFFHPEHEVALALALFEKIIVRLDHALTTLQAHVESSISREEAAYQAYLDQKAAEALRRSTLQRAIDQALNAQKHLSTLTGK